MQDTRSQRIPNEASMHGRSYCARTEDMLHGSGRILTRKATLQTKALAATQADRAETAVELTTLARTRSEHCIEGLAADERENPKMTHNDRSRRWCSRGFIERYEKRAKAARVLFLSPSRSGQCKASVWRGIHNLRRGVTNLEPRDAEELCGPQDLREAGAGGMHRGA